MDLNTQKKKAEQFHKLHHDGNFLLLPNIWDPIGAALLQNLGYPAVATASYATAWTQGYLDGEQIPVDKLLYMVKQIAQSVSIPVSVDFERGFARYKAPLQQNVKDLIAAGAVGLNIEDKSNSGELVSLERQCDRIEWIKRAAEETGVPLFINARTDAYLLGDALSSEEKYEETLKRGLAYKEAGAHCIYPILMKDKDQIKNLVDALDMPININTIPGTPDLKTLKSLGVSRVSIGPGLFKLAFKAMKESAEQLLDFEGVDQITQNPISTQYINELLEKGDQ